MKPYSERIYELKSISKYQATLDSKKRKNVRLTTIKHLDVFLKEKKWHMKENESGWFYFLEREMESALKVKEAK